MPLVFQVRENIHKLLPNFLTSFFYLKTSKPLHVENRMNIGGSRDSFSIDSYVENGPFSGVSGVGFHGPTGPRTHGLPGPFTGLAPYVIVLL